jgi:hypothetical protein
MRQRRADATDAPLEEVNFMHLLAGEMARLRYQEVAALAGRAEARQRHALRWDREQWNAWLRSMWSR